MKLHLYPFVFALFLITACSNTDSGNVNSPGIYAGFSVTNNGSQSNISAQLKVGGFLSNTVLELSDGDSLVAYNGSQSHLMSKDSSILGNVRYRASFPGDIGGTRYTITFNRPSTNESISSSVTLPADFNLTSDHTGSFTDTDNLFISWDTASSLLTRISLSGLCGTYSAVVRAGAMSTNIPLSSVTKTNPGASACTLNIGVSRKTQASVNSEFGEGGIFTAEQNRTSSFRFSY